MVVNNKIYDVDNIHRTLNSIFPFFKSRFLCKKDIHNFGIFPYDKIKKVIYEDSTFHTTEIKYIRESKEYLKCLCCGKTIELEEK